jgi:phage baseplate assembly protein W
MATIDLNNLIRPKKINSPNTDISQRVPKIAPIYVDLHLDLSFEKSIGLGDRSVSSKDILVDTDVQAIKNSIRNIFSTRKGEKLLSPEFGCNLEKYLFNAVSDLGARAIGSDINEAITRYEPRVDVVKIYVETNPYATKNVKLSGRNLTAVEKNKIYGYSDVQKEIGPGYSITVIYEIKESKNQDFLNLFAQIGGQILF